MSLSQDGGAARLIVWALATFHASAFVLVLVLVLYSRGALSGILGGLNTLVGFAIFLALWATTWYATRRALETLSWAEAGASGGEAVFVRRALRWGGVNGVLFLAVLGCAQLALALVQALSGAGQFVPFGIAFAVLGAPFAFVFGAFVGVVLATLDLVLLSAARRIVSYCLEGERAA